MVLTIRCSKFPFADAARSLFFVFRDSLVNNGNNNYLHSSGRADTPPYRICYLTHARWSLLQWPQHL
ncbi:hypothetical protein MLD38_029674 [Melastoma candidum]|uniref:Uncharacterized protein n=1 Tax=Melastoma candidum TaxID=119954 RepID=A0ACB9N6I1_9MYRT|nr:hypothetical protein MLD38_029674 [Melastoma candidum]